MPNREKIKNLLDKVIELDILVILFSLPFSKSVVETGIAIAIIAFILKIFIKGALRLEMSGEVLFALSLFLFFNALSVINSYDRLLSIHAFFSKSLKWTLFFVIVADTIKSPRQVKMIVITMLLSCSLIMIDAFHQYYGTGIDFLHYPNRYKVFKFHDRPAGAATFPTASFPFPSDFAAWINMYLFTFISLLLFDFKGKTDYKIFLVMLAALLAFFLFMTTSKGALFGALLSAPLIIAIKARRLFIFLTVSLLLLTTVLCAIPHTRACLKAVVLDEALSINDRAKMWSVGWQSFRIHPVIGNGVNTFFGNFKNLRTDEDRFKKGSYAHNCFLQMASDIGILGLMSFLAFVFFVLRDRMRKAARERATISGAFVLGLSLGAIAFLAHSFFDTNLYSLNLAALFWLALGCVEGVKLGSDEAK